MTDRRPNRATDLPEALERAAECSKYIADRLSACHLYDPNDAAWIEKNEDLVRSLGVHPDYENQEETLLRELVGSSESVFVDPKIHSYAEPWQKDIADLLLDLAIPLEQLNSRMKQSWLRVEGFIAGVEHAVKHAKSLCLNGRLEGKIHDMVFCDNVKCDRLISEDSAPLL